MVVSATSPKFAAMAIRKIAELGWKPLHIITNVSTSVATVMTPAGLENGIGTISSAYIKDPNDPAWANDLGVLDWRAFMTKYYPAGDQNDINNMIGYCFAYSLVAVLKGCGGDFSRENIMKQASNLRAVVVPGLLPGITLNTTPTDFKPIQQLQMSKFDGKGWRRFGDIIKSS